VCRDFKKEGMTKPRQLLRDCLEVLKKRYPNCEAFEYPDFYDEFPVEKDGKVYYPCRGHGLGMANSLTTLIQIIVQYMVYEEVESEIQLNFITHNDDIVIRIDGDESDLEEYWSADSNVTESLGMIRNNKKSFWSKTGFVFIERYRSSHSLTLDKKESYRRRESLLPLTATDYSSQANGC